MIKGRKILLVAMLLVMVALASFTAAVRAEAGTPAGSVQQTTGTPPRVETYGIGWGTLMLINAGLAQGKNRSGLNWFLISLFLGPLATFLLVAFFPKLPEAAPQPHKQAG